MTYLGIDVGTSAVEAVLAETSEPLAVSRPRPRQPRPGDPLGAPHGDDGRVRACPFDLHEGEVLGPHPGLGFAPLG